MVFGDFRPNLYRIDIPQPIAKKSGTNDCVGDPYFCTKFGVNPSTGELVGICVIYNQSLKFILFLELTTGQTRRQIFALRLMGQTTRTHVVPFGGLVDIAPI